MKDPQETFIVLGGSWVVISGVIRSLIWLMITVTLLITTLMTTHEPPRVGHAAGVAWISRLALLSRIINSSGIHRRLLRWAPGPSPLHY